MMMRSVAAPCDCVGEEPATDVASAAADAAVVMGGAIVTAPKAGVAVVVAVLATVLLADAADAARAGEFSPDEARCWLANKSAKGSDGVPKREAGGGVGVGVAGSGASATNRLATDVQALVQSSTVTAGDEVSLLATDNSTIEAVTGASALSASFAAIGVAMAIGVADATHLVGYAKAKCAHSRHNKRESCW